MVGNTSKKVDEEESEINEPVPTRRKVLKTSSAAAAGAAGFGMATGAVAADEEDFEEEEDEDKWGDLQCLADGVEEDDIWGPFECVQDWQEPDEEKGIINLDPPWYCFCDARTENWDISDLDHHNNELLIYVHGYGAKFDAGPQAHTLDLELDGFDGLVVAAQWPSMTAPFTPAWDNAAEYGRKLADWIVDDLFAARPNATVHLVGHSLGGRASFNTLNRLNERGEQINKVITVGPADNVDFVTQHDRDHSDDCDWSSWDDRNEEYYHGIQNASEETYIFHSDNDWTVGCLYERWASDMLCYTPDGEGLGNPVYQDIDDSLGPANLKTEDVSALVDDHCDYFKPHTAGHVIDEKL